ncbi:MAG: thioredoxin domain-containing protein [Pseudolabrys sp.]
MSRSPTLCSASSAPGRSKSRWRRCSRSPSRPALTQQTFDACLANQKVLDGIESIRQRAVTVFKVESTPTFFINGTKYAGALEIDEMAKLIDAQVKG